MEMFGAFQPWDLLMKIGETSSKFGKKKQSDLKWMAEIDDLHPFLFKQRFGSSYNYLEP